jgi:hypothetical protein
MRFITTSIQDDQQREIAFEVDVEAEGFARWIMDYFESQMKLGTRFENGQIIELGWSVLLLREIDNILELFEPDFQSMPIRWSKGVNATVRDLYLQRAVCEIFGCEPAFPSVRHAGIVSPQFAASREYRMFRDAPSGSDSGWVFAGVDHTASEGEFSSLYQISLLKAEVVPFLALPISSRVLKRPDFCEVTLDGIRKSSDDCEILRRLAGPAGLEN